MPDCSSLTFVGRLAFNSFGDFVDLYARRGDPPYAISTYDIYAHWTFSGHSITVGVNDYELAIALEWSIHHSLFHINGAQSAECHLIGNIDTTDFLATTQAGVWGTSGTTGCSVTVTESYSLTAGIEYKFGPTPGASGTLSGTVGWQQSTTCTNGTLFDSELVLASPPHEPERVPPTA